MVLLQVILRILVVIVVKGSGLPRRLVQEQLLMSFRIRILGTQRRGDGKDCAPLPPKERGARWACLAVFFLALGLGDDFLALGTPGTCLRREQSISGVSPIQLVFGRNPEIPGILFSDKPDLIANSSMLHDRDAGQAARVRTLARTKLMLHSDKLNARRALDTRPS